MARTKPKPLRKFVKNSSMTLMSLVLSALIVVGCIYFYMIINLPDVNQLKDIHLQVPLRVYTSDGKLIGEFGQKKRIPVTIDQIPAKLIQAVLDTEDQRFYEHNGVDFIGLLRASVAVISSGRMSQGASTITMQVARNFFLSPEKSFTRKINEMLLALKIDSEFSKKEILELYLNKIFVGQQAYGVAAAAQIYYGKNLDQLTLPEMAMIAGLPQAPSRDNPVANPKGAIERRNHVLERMYENGHISKSEYKAAIAAKNNDIVNSGLQLEVDAPYLAEMVRNTLYDKLGDKVYDDGYKVYTTIDSRLQYAANKALHDGLIKYNLRHGGSANSDPKVEGALVALNTKNGAILALNGGYSYARSNFNRAIQAGRQSGSAFKPFIYSAALEKGYTLASVINDAPIALAIPGTGFIWKPQNDTQRFYGLTRLRKALSQSQNLVSIRLLQSIGLSYTVDYVKRFGFEGDEIPATPSLALGTTAISPLKLTAGYATFANGGYKITPYFVDRIENRDGKILFQAKPPIVPTVDTNDPAYAPRVITAQNAYLMTNALKDVITYGTAKKALALKRSDLSGKTGTTNNQKDAWFSGFNSDLVATVWVGYDQPQSLYEHGAQAALPIWVDFINSALAGKPEHSLEEPSGITTARIDPVSGKLARPNQQNAIFEIFTNNTVPTEIAPENSVGTTENVDQNADSPGDYDEENDANATLDQQDSTNDSLF